MRKGYVALWITYSEHREDLENVDPDFCGTIPNAVKFAKRWARDNGAPFMRGFFNSRVVGEGFGPESGIGDLLRVWMAQEAEKEIASWDYKFRTNLAVLPRHEPIATDRP